MKIFTESEGKMKKVVATEQGLDIEQAKIAELFYRFMEFQKRHKGKKLTYLIVCTANTPKDLENLLGNQESVNISLEGFHACQGYGSLLSLMLAGELEKDTLTNAIEMKECMEDGNKEYEKTTKH